MTPRAVQCLARGVLLLLILLVVGCGGPEERRDEFMASARKYFDKGRFEEARLELKNAVKADPSHAPAYTLIGKCDLEAALWSDAFKSFSRAVELDPDALEARIGLAQLYLMGGQLENMEKEVGYVLGHDPANPDGLLLKAAGLHRKGDVEAGLELAREVAGRHPEMEDCWVLLNYFHSQDGDQALATQVLLDGLAHIPDSLTLKLLLAAAHAAQGEVAEAEALYKGLARDNPDNATFQLALGEFYLSQREYDKAEVLGRELVDKYPDEQDYRLNLAQVFLARREPGKAVEIIRQGIEEIEDAYQLRLTLIGMLRDQARLDEAARLAEETVELDPDSPMAVSVQGQLAEIRYAQGDVAQAREALKMIFARNPKDMTSRILDGRIDLLDDNPVQAISKFRQVLADDPDRMEAYGYLARAHLHNGEPALAKDVLAKALERDPGCRAARTALINVYMREGDYGRAMDQLRQAIEQDPEEPALYSAVGDLQMLQKEYASAERYYKEVARLDPDNVVGPYKLGQVYAASGEPDKAIERFQAILEMIPDFFPAAEGVVNVCIDQRRYKQAQDFLDVFQARNPGPGALDLRGRVAAAQGDAPKAEEYFLQAIEMDPGWIGAYHRLAVMYVATGRAGQAKVKLQEALEADPGAVGLAYLLGLLAQEMGEMEESEKNYLKALEGKPNFAPAANNLAYLYAEFFAEDSVRMEKAMSLAEMAARLRTAETLDTLGWVLFKNGELRPALDVLMEALILRPGDPTVLYHLASVYKAMDDTAQAKDRLQQALRQGDFPGKEKAQALFDSM